MRKLVRVKPIQLSLLYIEWRLSTICQSTSGNKPDNIYYTSCYICVSTSIETHSCENKEPDNFFDRVLQFIVLSYTEIICCISTCFVSHLRKLLYIILKYISSHLKFNLYMVSLTSTMHLIQMHTMSDCIRIHNEL